MMQKQFPMYKFMLRGIVQGVGFRPYIHNACVDAGLSGYVQNAGNGVVVVVNDKVRFEEILKHIPNRARIDTVEISEANEICDGFGIKESVGSGFAEIPPDNYLCPECAKELGDKTSRRANYYFMTCTACGPRFTIAVESPYDRNTTTMSEFPMCATCKKEYTNPRDRRYHAQTIACHNCGPRLSLYDDRIRLRHDDDEATLKNVAALLQEGEIVAIKGVGGFHLACAANTESVAKLNRMTGRTHKPYAVMCADIEAAREIALVSKGEEEMLLSQARPIVLLKKRGDFSSVSELDTIGIMLPYSALHEILFRFYKAPIVLTSSNISDEPITTTKGEQFVPHVLDHDRTIENSADDSVIKFIEDIPLYIRRSRGFVPGSIKIKAEAHPPILALGAEMNNAFALYDGKGSVILSQHMGNTSNIESLEHYKESIHKFLAYTHIAPALILRDLHPSYNTSLYGEELSRELDVPLQSVQHHRAHAFGAALEHNLTDFVAIVADGMGYGDDGTIWGGEIFENNERIGHLELQPQLGGDSATRFPHKMLFGILRSFVSREEVGKILCNEFTDKELGILDKQLSEKFNTPMTSSAGRILDATAGLLGLCKERTYDGRPAMLLESVSTTPYELPPTIVDSVLKTTPLFEFLIKNLDKDKGRLAATAEQYLAAGLYGIAKKKNKPIVFAGGCAYNRTMTAFMLKQGVLINKNVPAGDGGISFGQIASVLSSTGASIPK